VRSHGSLGRGAAWYSDVLHSRGATNYRKNYRFYLSDTPAKSIAYIRVSTGHQEISPEIQRERIEAYCKMAGLDLTEVIVERGVSAKLKLAKRPAGAKIAALLESGVCHVVALKLDRLFRNAADALATTEQWNQAGISLHQSASFRYARDGARYEKEPLSFEPSGGAPRLVVNALVGVHCDIKEGHSF
jgi:hypothetical protein